MVTCQENFRYCEDGCCVDHTIHCCNITCNSKGQVCYFAPSSPEETMNELLAGLLGLVIFGLLFLLIKLKCDVSKLCCCDCNCLDDAFDCMCDICKVGESTCQNKVTNCCRRNQQNEETLQDSDADVTNTPEPVSPSFQHRNMDIQSDEISHGSDGDTQSFSSIITEQPDNNRLIADTETNSTSSLPTYEEVTRNDPPCYTVALLYPLNLDT